MGRPMCFRCDASVAANLTFVAGSAPLDVEGVLGALHPQEGMRYCHLLLARLHGVLESAKLFDATPRALTLDTKSSCVIRIVSWLP